MLLLLPDEEGELVASPSSFRAFNMDPLASAAGSNPAARELPRRVSDAFLSSTAASVSPSVEVRVELNLKR